MGNFDKHPEQDPAEGSREIVERDLERQEKRRPEPPNGDNEAPNTSSAGAEAAEPSPGS